MTLVVSASPLQAKVERRENGTVGGVSNLPFFMAQPIRQEALGNSHAWSQSHLLYFLKQGIEVDNKTLALWEA